MDMENIYLTEAATEDTIKRFKKAVLDKNCTNPHAMAGIALQYESKGPDKDSIMLSLVSDSLKGKWHPSEFDLLDVITQDDIPEGKNISNMLNIYKYFMIQLNHKYFPKYKYVIGVD